MKRIRITGANSYIGTSFENYINESFADRYTVDTVDMIDGSWREKDFSGYDAVFHVAGIAHSDTGKVSEERKRFYYQINTDLTIETAKKAKSDGVRQFIFMSSAIVYGDSAPIGKKKVITKETPLSPANFYGDSKVQAEKGILPLADDRFRVVILRPPMIYGKGSKGNYPQLSKFAQKLPFFPNVKNERSMLFVGNLVEFVRLMIENEESGIFFPQNAQYTGTSEMVKLIAESHGKKISLIKGFTWLLKIMSHVTGLVNKAFGNLSYDMDLSEYKENYRRFSLEESVRKTEKTEKSMNPRAMILASVASMIDQFNMNNIQLLLDNGYDVDVVCNCKDGNNISQERVKFLINSLAQKGVVVFDVPIPRKIHDVKGIRKSISILKGMANEKEYTLLHCQSPIGSVVARWAFKKSRKCGTKVVYTAHGFHFYKGAPLANWVLFFPIEKLFSRYTDSLITINKEDYAFAKKHMKHLKVYYVPGIGVDTAYFGQVVDKAEKRNNFSIDTDKVIVLSVGETNTNKNHEVIIKALSKLNHDDIVYLIVGVGREKENTLIELADSGKVDLRLLGYRTDVKDIYQMADIYAFPSFREGLSVSLMEAMASGLPCVASNIRGNTDLVDDGKGGFLCEPTDIDGFAQRINDLVIDKDKRKIFSNYNLKKIKDFDKENVMKKVSRVYFS